MYFKGYLSGTNLSLMCYIFLLVLNVSVIFSLTWVFRSRLFIYNGHGLTFMWVCTFCSFSTFHSNLVKGQFYRVLIGIQSPEGVTTTRYVLIRFNDFLKFLSAVSLLFNVFPQFCYIFPVHQVEKRKLEIKVMSSILATMVSFHQVFLSYNIIYTIT